MPGALVRTIKADDSDSGFEIGYSLWHNWLSMNHHKLREQERSGYDSPGKRLM